MQFLVNSYSPQAPLSAASGQLPSIACITVLNASAEIGSCAVSPSTSKLVAVGGDGEIRLWNLQQQQVRLLLENELFPVTQMERGILCSSFLFSMLTSRFSSYALTLVLVRGVVVSVRSKEGSQGPSSRTWGDP